MQKLFLLFFVFSVSVAAAQSKNEKQIREILNEQTAAWNRGDIPAFMNGYWQNDSLMFIGKNGIVYGWQQTLENYKKNYPSPNAMGKLSFEIIKVDKLSSKYYSVIGKWMLVRSIGDVGGHFSLLFKKINGQWKIVSDHSS
jgi:ketosteroid isomerase-like protein